MFRIEKSTSVQANCVSRPRMRYDTIVADTEDSNSGRSELIDRLNRRISRVNSTPASGALKMPATAPAAPQPSRSVIPR